MHSLIGLFVFLPYMLIPALILQSSSAAFAYVMERSEAEEEIELVRFSADENFEFLNLLNRGRTQNCKWFSFSFLCARASVSAKVVAEIESRLRGKHPRHIQEWEGLAQQKYKFYPPDKDTLYFAKSQPGYVSSLAYEGERKKLWDTVPKSNYGGGLVPPTSKGPARPLKIVIPASFASYTGWQDYGDTQWFDSFAEKQAVEDGDQVAAFWRNFARFSADHTCLKDCLGAFEFHHPNTDSALIRRCTIAVVERIAGAPDNCVTMVLFDGGKTYIRTTKRFIGPTLGADGGTDDIECGPPKGMSEQGVLLQLKKAFEGLNGADTQYRVAVRNGTLIAVNRYTKSAFFDGYENSTIRISAGISSDPPASPTFVIATSFYVSKTEATSPERYSGPTAAQTKHAIQKLYDLFPPNLNCRILNP